MASTDAPKDLPKMQYRFLGRSGLQVSAISLGGWLTYGGQVEDDKTFACMKAAYDAGINFFDCAEGYAGGESEKSMGAAIAKYGWSRYDLVISTKIYWGGAFGSNPVNNTGLSRKHIIEGVNQSLERLGLEYVDLIYAHRPDRNTPMEETVRAFNHVINQGKALYWGTSEWSASEIATAMLARDKVDGEFNHLYEEFGTGLTIFSPLKTGILTGKYNDGIPADSRYSRDDKDPFILRMTKEFGEGKWEAQLETVRKLKPVADKLGVTQAQLAYAWVLSNKNVSSAIMGATKPEQVRQAVRSLEMVELLTPEVLEEIEGILGNKPSVAPRRY
ncbi:hypothetical protein VE04_09979 [Pseudogymnoascus sp. 24MN13]|nr:hypothetical protein VE04_09979 [Pseudogymnoascus sp. 24MN13]